MIDLQQRKRTLKKNVLQVVRHHFSTIISWKNTYFKLNFLSAYQYLKGGKSQEVGSTKFMLNFFLKNFYKTKNRLLNNFNDKVVRFHKNIGIKNTPLIIIHYNCIYFIKKNIE